MKPLTRFRMALKLSPCKRRVLIAGAIGESVEFVRPMVLRTKYSRMISGWSRAACLDKMELFTLQPKEEWSIHDAKADTFHHTTIVNFIASTSTDGPASIALDQSLCQELFSASVRLQRHDRVGKYG
jgi:hypothetical protein